MADDQLVEVRCDRLACERPINRVLASEIVTNEKFNCAYCGFETKLSPEALRDAKGQIK
jgi:hypothetical protein